MELRFVLNGETSDTERSRFGIREVGSTVTREGNWVRRDFFVNGKKIWLKGGKPAVLLERYLYRHPPREVLGCDSRISEVGPRGC